MRVLERYLILQIIDQRWREHLYDMDYLREGIHLRGFAQIEPLVAYKNEAFTLFEDLMNSIWADFARMIYNVEVEVQGPEDQQQAAQEWTPAPQQPQSNFGALEYSGGTLEEQPTAYGDPEEGSPQEPPVVAQRRVDRERERSVATTRAGAARARSSRSATEPEVTPARLRARHRVGPVRALKRVAHQVLCVDLCDWEHATQSARRAPSIQIMVLAVL